MEEDLIGTIDSVMGHLKDDLASRKGKLKIREAGTDKVAELVIQRDHIRNLVEEHNANLDFTKRELAAVREDLEVRDKEVKKQAELLDRSTDTIVQAQRENGQMKAKLETLGVVKVKNDRLRAEATQLKKDLAKSTPQVIEGFLRSKGFKCATQVALVDHMRFVIYEELRKLGKFYPFVPEQMGYATIAPELAILKDLSCNKWDEGKDILVSTNGEEVPKRLKLSNCEGSRLMHFWDLTIWPSDVRSRTQSHGAAPQNR